MSRSVDAILRETCLEIELRYEIRFLEIGLDGDHAHFLMQSVPTYSPTKIARTVKSLIAREVFSKDSGVKDLLWGGEFWGKGFFMNTVGQHGSESVIAEYVRMQGDESHYECLHKAVVQSDFFS